MEKERKMEKGKTKTITTISIRNRRNKLPKPKTYRENTFSTYPAQLLSFYPFTRALFTAISRAGHVSFNLRHPPPIPFRLLNMSFFLRLRLYIFYPTGQ